MKNKIQHLILAGLLGTAIASQGAVIYTHTYLFGTASVDGGAFSSNTATYTQNFTNVGGTDVSFDLVLTAVASANWSAAGTGIAGGDNGRVDPGESGTFSLSIANFNAGTSNYIEANVDFGLTIHGLNNDAKGASDSGTFTLINGVAPSSTLTWTDSNGGSDFTGHSGNFNLPLMNETYGDGSNVTSFTHLGAGAAWRFNNQAIFYSLPEPSSTALLGLGLSSLLLRRKRS